MKTKIIDIEGAKLVLTNNPNTRALHTLIKFQTGTLFETLDDNGINHFIEHLIYKGSKKFRNNEQIDGAIEELGGIFNGGTSIEETEYSLLIPARHGIKAINILLDLIANPLFRKSDIKNVKKVIIEEKLLENDNPESVLLEKFMDFYYGNCQFGWSIDGPIHNIKSFSQEQLFEYKNKLYTKDNMVIGIAGRVLNENELIDTIYEAIKNIPAKKEKSKEVIEPIKPNLRINSSKIKSRYSHLIMGTPGFNFFDDRKYAVQILTTILGGYNSSLLFQKLREKQGICYHVSSGHDSYINLGQTTISSSFSKRNLKKGIREIEITLKDISGGNISPKDFNKARNHLIGSLELGYSCIEDVNNYFSTQILFGDRPLNINQLIKKYETVSYEQVLEIASQLTPENFFTFYVH